MLHPRNLVMQPMILTIAESQDKNDFEQSTLVKNAQLIINTASQEHLVLQHVRAYDDTDARLQEELLKKTIPLAKQLDVQVIARMLVVLDVHVNREMCPSSRHL